MKRTFSAEELKSGLNELVERLSQHDIESSIYIVGGAAFLFRGVSRRLTVDIDAKVTNAGLVLKLADEIAEQNGWPTEWFNNAARIFVPFETDYEKWELYLSKGQVRVYLAPLEDLLVMKLNAARPTRDDEDILYLLGQLNLKTPDQIIDFYEARVKGETLPQKALKLLSQILEVTNE